MLGKLALLENASRLTHYAGARHSVIGENIANADTPGYLARDLQPFTLEDTGRTAMRATRAEHISATSANADGFLARAEASGDTLSANGNSVSLEDQMLRSADAQRQHRLATSVYRKAMDILRVSASAPRT